MHQVLVLSIITPLYLQAQKLHTLVKRNPLKCKCLRLSSARVKIHQISNANFETTSQFLFKCCIIVHGHDTQILSKFWVLWWKFATFIMSISKPQVSFSSNFASFSFLKDTFCTFIFLTFLAQTLYTLVKKSPLNCKFFRLSIALVKIHQIRVIFETNQFFFKICITLHCHET